MFIDSQTIGNNGLIIEVLVHIIYICTFPSILSFLHSDRYLYKVPEDDPVLIRANVSGHTFLNTSLDKCSLFLELQPQ